MQAFSREDLQSLLDAFMTSDSDFAEPLFNDETKQLLLSQAKVEASQVDQVGTAEIDPYAVELYEEYQRTKEDQLTIDAIIEREKIREKIEAMEGFKGITTLNQIEQEYQNAKTNVIEIYRKRSQQVEERLLKLSESMVEVLQKKIAEIFSAKHVKAIPHQEIEALLSLMEVEEIRKCSFFKELDKLQYLFLRAGSELNSVEHPEWMFKHLSAILQTVQSKVDSKQHMCSFIKNLVIYFSEGIYKRILQDLEEFCEEEQIDDRNAIGVKMITSITNFDKEIAEKYFEDSSHQQTVLETILSKPNSENYLNQLVDSITHAWKKDLHETLEQLYVCCDKSLTKLLQNNMKQILTLLEDHFVKPFAIYKGEQVTNLIVQPCIRILGDQLRGIINEKQADMLELKQKKHLVEYLGILKGLKTLLHEVKTLSGKFNALWHSELHDNTIAKLEAVLIDTLYERLVQELTLAYSDALYIRVADFFGTVYPLLKVNLSNHIEPEYFIELVLRIMLRLKKNIATISEQKDKPVELLSLAKGVKERKSESEKAIEVRVQLTQICERHMIPISF
ncbi:hypothetical protein FGO68_gene8603 [Halteria grandinella]|uniref:Exocyst complex component Sec6 n=1 Tax=Halteria grandinella TaxID=5974 RepID=A0A8J8NU10_HALGN|nr:hypothetical protein FGO68_gene8603 [Halteria grandinella]